MRVDVCVGSSWVQPEHKQSIYAVRAECDYYTWFGVQRHGIFRNHIHTFKRVNLPERMLSGKKRYM